MSHTVRFFIPIEPRGQARARSGINGHHYKSATQKLDEQKLAAHIVTQHNGSRLTGPLRLDLVAVLPVPASWPQKRRESALGGLERPTKKPDLSNIIKNAEDVLQGLVFDDDKAIVEMVASKIYGDKPGYQITLTELSAMERI